MNVSKPMPCSQEHVSMRSSETTKEPGNQFVPPIISFLSLSFFVNFFFLFLVSFLFSPSAPISSGLGSISEPQGKALNAALAP